MLLAIAPLGILFFAVTGILGATLLANLRRKDEPGAAVAIEFLPEDSDFAVKAYAQKGGFYEAHVYYKQRFMAREGGLPSAQNAIGWGFNFARTHHVHGVF